MSREREQGASWSGSPSRGGVPILVPSLIGGAAVCWVPLQGVPGGLRRVLLSTRGSLRVHSILGVQHLPWTGWAPSSAGAPGLLGPPGMPAFTGTHLHSGSCTHRGGGWAQQFSRGRSP